MRDPEELQMRNFPIKYKDAEHDSGMRLRNERQERKANAKIHHGMRGGHEIVYWFFRDTHKPQRCG